MEHAGKLRRWQAPQGALPVGNLDQTLPARIDSEESGTETDTKMLLFDILRVLQRMDTRMEGHDKRLNTLETSNQSEGFEGARSHWPAFDVAQSSHSKIRKEPANQYENSLLKMKMKYEFDDSASCLEIATSETEPIPASKNIKYKNHSSECLDVGKRDTDSYSLSIYTENLLDSNTIQAPESSALEKSQLSDIPGSQNDIHDADDTPSTPSSDVASRSSSEDSWKTSSSGRSKAPHEGVELAFQVYDNWKHGVLSRMRNEARAAQKKEMERLRVIRPSHETGQSLPWKLFSLAAKRAVWSNGSKLLFGQRVDRDRRVVVVC
jgi:hypothetical protein